LSGFFILASLVGLFARGLNFSIDFKGGSLLQFPDRSGASVTDYQRILAKYGIKEATVEIVAGQDCPQGCVNIRTKSLTTLAGPATSASPSASSFAPATTAPSPSASASAAPSPSASASASPS